MFTDHLFKASKSIWEKYLEHPFINEIGKGTLDKEKFKRYLIQDYLYLKEYTKVYCMAVVKSDTMNEMKMFYEGVSGILNDEAANHINYLEYFGEKIDGLENYKYHKVTENYTNYMKAISITSGIKEIVASVLPCTWSYNYIGKYLKENYSEFMDGNFYESWIETYSGEEFSRFTCEWIDFTNKLCENITDSEKEKLIEIFTKASIHEMEFWDMAYESMVN